MDILKLNPNERRLLIVVTEDEKYVLDIEPDGHKLLAQPYVKVVAIQQVQDQNIIFVGRDGRLQPGMVLVLSPFNDSTYVDLTGIRYLVAIEKMHSITRLCQLLGAKSVAIERLEIIDNIRNESISWDLEAGGMSGSLQGKAEDMQMLKNSLQLDVKLRGGKIDENGAKEYFKTSRFSSDSSIRYIFIMRLDKNNPVTNFKQDISLSESLQSSIELLASLDLPELFTKLNLQSLLRSKFSVEQIVKEKIEIISRINISF